MNRPGLIAEIEKALGEFEPREQQMMRRRFGLDDGQVRTLEEVGKEFGVTRKRVAQIESRVLAKLRPPDGQSGDRAPLGPTGPGPLEGGAHAPQ